MEVQLAAYSSTLHNVNCQLIESERNCRMCVCVCNENEKRKITEIIIIIKKTISAAIQK